MLLEPRRSGTELPARKKSQKMSGVFDMAEKRRVTKVTKSKFIINKGLRIRTNNFILRERKLNFLILGSKSRVKKV